MKQSESKKQNGPFKRLYLAVAERAFIVRASVVYNMQIETAYLSDLWSNMLSTLFYVIATVIFVDIIYSNVDVVASYTRAEMLLFIFIGQIGFYVMWAVSYSGISSLIEDVRKGDLDLVLVKPLPTLFYLETRRVHIVRTFRDAIAPTIVLFFVVPWSELSLTPLTVLAGVAIMLMGYICLHIYMLIFALPVFWVGESKNILGLAWTMYTFTDGRIPFEGFGSTLKIVFSVVLPLLWSTGIATSVMLGKSNALIMLLACGAVALVFLYLRSFFWRKAMLAYSSASS